MGEQLVQGCYTVASGRLEPATFRLQGIDHTATPPHPTNHQITSIYNEMLVTVATYTTQMILTSTSNVSRTCHSSCSLVRMAFERLFPRVGLLASFDALLTLSGEGGLLHRVRPLARFRRRTLLRARLHGVGRTPVVARSVMCEFDSWRRSSAGGKAEISD